MLFLGGLAEGVHVEHAFRSAFGLFRLGAKGITFDDESLGRVLDVLHALKKKVVVVPQDRRVGDTTRLGDVLTQELAGQGAKDIAANLGGLGHGAADHLPGGASRLLAAAAKHVAVDTVRLNGDRRLRGKQGAVRREAHFQTRVVIGGKHAAQMVHTHGDEDAAIRSRSDLRLVGTEFDLREFVLGSLFFLLGPPTKATAKFFNVHLHARAGSAGKEKEQGEGAKIHADPQCCKKQYFQLRGGTGHLVSKAQQPQVSRPVM